MIFLCQNRFVLPGSPSTCTIDTVLVPLPSFLLVVFTGFMLWRRSDDRSRMVIPRWLHILYMVLVFATIAMTILELARDIADKLGVGLLPMVLIALIIVFFGLRYELRGHSKSLSALFFAYWLLNIVFQSIKVVRLQKLVQLDPAKTMYPSSDQLLDNAVILGLYVIFLIIEGWGLVFSRRTYHDQIPLEDKPTTV